MLDIKVRLDGLKLPLPVLAWGVPGIRLGLHWKLRTLGKPFGFLVLKPSGVRFAEVSFRNYLFDGLIYYKTRIWIRI